MPKSVSTSSKVHRFLRLLQLVDRLSSRDAVNSTDLSKGLRVSIRTIHRDLAFLRSLGFGVDYDEASHNLKLVSKPQDLFSNGVSPEEGFALGIARNALSAYGGSGFFAQVLRQIQRLMDRWRVDPEDLGTGFLSFPNNELFPDALISSLYQAIVRSHIVEFYYDSLTSKSRTREVEPLHVFYREGAWYLYGKEKGEGRTFHLRRIRDYSILDRTFEPPKSFEIQKLLEDSFGVYEGAKPQWIEILFSAPASRIVSERHWHRSQTMHWEGKRLRFRMRVIVSVEIERWILGWGEQAIVISPKSLRTVVMSRLEKARANYPSNRCLDESETNIEETGQQET
jgi:predicted DNA-binding transcriptional regulator YafY